jgi:predicted transposase YbfD/YdcC
LDLDGHLVTGDALHWQSETAQLITGKSSDRLFALKANRPALHAAVAALFLTLKAI